jgi:hypothetical protein
MYQNSSSGLAFGPDFPEVVQKNLKNLDILVDHLIVIKNCPVILTYDVKIERVYIGNFFLDPDQDPAGGTGFPDRFNYRK